MRTRVLMAMGLALAAGLAAGCSKTQPDLPKGYQSSLTGVTVEIWPEGEGSATTNTADGGTVESGGVKVELHRLRLTVNGADYGLVNPGEGVIVNRNKNNEVWVNGLVRNVGGTTAPPAPPPAKG